MYVDGRVSRVRPRRRPLSIRLRTANRTIKQKALSDLRSDQKFKNEGEDGRGRTDGQRSLTCNCKAEIDIQRVPSHYTETRLNFDSSVTWAMGAGGGRTTVGKCLARFRIPLPQRPNRFELPSTLSLPPSLSLSLSLSVSVCLSSESTQAEFHARANAHSHLQRGLGRCSAFFCHKQKTKEWKIRWRLQHE